MGDGAATGGVIFTGTPIDREIAARFISRRRRSERRGRGAALLVDLDRVLGNLLLIFSFVCCRTDPLKLDHRSGLTLLNLERRVQHWS